MTDTNIGAQDLVSTRPVQNPPKVLALVIGINTYTGSYNNLTGAVADADAFQHFLTRKLLVPTQNIHSLRDGQASRRGILEGFFFLRDNQTYANDEVEIIIYYAGHGAQESIPVEWKGWYTPTGRIEMLCPSDIGAYEGKSVVPGIPDRTINRLLDQISFRKGRHITVVMDCCSSAGLNRGGIRRSQRYIPRQLFNPPPFPKNVDGDILQGGAVEGQGPMFHRSHVLLAACGREQMALEDPERKRGLFTHNLLKILMSDQFETLTYRSLMDKLTMPTNQTPHCEGKGVDRLLFGNKGSSSDAAFIHTKRAANKTITLEAGSAQGITVGTRFSVHKMDVFDSSFLPNPSLGSLVATAVQAFSSTLKELDASPRLRLPWRFYCKAADGGPHHISVYSKDKAWLEQMFPTENQYMSQVDVVDNAADCNLELTVTRDHAIYFDRHNNSVISYIGARIPHTAHKDDSRALYRIIHAMRHFNYQLTRTAPKDASGVRMELRLLESAVGTESDENYADFRSIGDNLLAQEPATISVDDDHCFGFNIINDSDRVLYPYLFYFDPNDLSITEIYSPPLGAGHGRSIAHTEVEQPSFSVAASETTALPPNRFKIGVDAVLPPKAHLTIGYGNGGCKPWYFYLPDGKSRDIGYLRLFLSTRPANFQSITQKSPFENNRGGGYTAPGDIEDMDQWMTKTATILQTTA